MLFINKICLNQSDLLYIDNIMQGNIHYFIFVSENNHKIKTNLF